MSIYPFIAYSYTLSVYFHCRSFYVAFNVSSMILCFHTTIFLFYVLNIMVDCMHVPNAHTQTISITYAVYLWAYPLHISKLCPNATQLHIQSKSDLLFMRCCIFNHQRTAACRCGIMKPGRNFWKRDEALLH